MLPVLLRAPGGQLWRGGGGARGAAQAHLQPLRQNLQQTVHPGPAHGQYRTVQIHLKWYKSKWYCRIVYDACLEAKIWAILSLRTGICATFRPSTNTQVTHSTTQQSQTWEEVQDAAIQDLEHAIAYG